MKVYKHCLFLLEAAIADNVSIKLLLTTPCELEGTVQ